MYEWYVATTKPFQELIAEQNLIQRGLQPFNPKCRVDRTIHNRRTSVIRSYLPGYIFIHFDITERFWKYIHTTRGISRLLSGDPETPTRIPLIMMRVILDRCVGGFVDEAEVDKAIEKIVPVGALVRLTAGPLEGREGRVVWSEFERVRVLLSIFCRDSDILLDKSNVEIIE